MKYRFIHERGDCPLLATEEIANVWSSSIKKTVACGDSPLFFIYKNGWVRIYGSEQCNQRNINFIFRKINQDKNYVRKIKNIFTEQSKIFLNFVEQLQQTDFKKLSNNQLIFLKEKYIKLYHQTAPYGEPLPFFLKEKLQQVLDDYLINQLKIQAKDYEILLAPIYQSFLEREKKDLFKITKKFKNREQFKKLIDQHTKQYQWLLFDYAGLVVDKKYFEKRAKEFFKKPPKFIDPRKLKNQKKLLLKKYKINHLHQYYLKILEDLYFLMDYKKEVLSQGHFAITPLYQEAGRRVGLNLAEVRWLSWEELKEFLSKNKKPLRKKVLARKKWSVVKFVNGKLKFLTREEGREIVREIEKEELVDKNIKEIKGVPISKGIVSGKICYLKSAFECDKMKNGEILLVSNTTPDFMPAIKKAKAIITNEGGITCHAAIISRELKIPAVVGTKIATQILKDGDLVEVNANNGIVKIIKV